MPVHGYHVYSFHCLDPVFNSHWHWKDLIIRKTGLTLHNAHAIETVASLLCWFRRRIVYLWIQTEKKCYRMFAVSIVRGHSGNEAIATFVPDDKTWKLPITCSHSYQRIIISDDSSYDCKALVPLGANQYWTNKFFLLHRVYGKNFAKFPRVRYQL